MTAFVPPVSRALFTCKYLFNTRPCFISFHRAVHLHCIKHRKPFKLFMIEISLDSDNTDGSFPQRITLPANS